MHTCRAFFPLISSLSTYPVPAYGGSARSAAPVRDALFGGAAQCRRGDLPDIALDSVPYAAAGAFSVNLWFQVQAHACKVLCTAACSLDLQGLPCGGRVSGRRCQDEVVNVRISTG